MDQTKVVQAVEHKDVVLAILPAAAGLAGLVLVFLGIVAADAGAFDPGTKKAIVRKRLLPAVPILSSFAIGVACVATSTWWLVILKDNHLLYVITLWLFGAELLSLLIAAFWTAKKSLWG